MDGVELEILWSNLIAIVDERAKALQRIAFSPVVREAGDLACALFDRRGRMVAQANTGTPGHINSLAIAGAHLVRMFHNRLAPGDVLVTNDPWLSAGHFFDITVLTPIFDGDTIIAFIGSTIHHTDIGGYGVGAGARDVHEEGLWIPPLKLYERGEPCEVLHAMIRSNVRTPDAVFGDLAAQVSSGRAASDRLIGMCRRYGVPDIEQLSDEIIGRSEAATRSAIGKLEAGTFEGESRFDVPGGEIITLKAAVTIDPMEGEITVDFTGSSPQSATGINVVLNYTHAYSTFAVRSCLNPDLPNNAGSLAPIKVIAPEGSIVNCSIPVAGERPPCGRHVCPDADPQGALSGDARPGDRRGLRRGMDDANSGPARRRRAVHLIHVQLFRRNGCPRHQARTQRDLLSHRSGSGAGRNSRSRDADRLRSQGIATRLRRGRILTRRRGPDHPIPHAHQESLAAQRGRQPSRRGT